MVQRIPRRLPVPSHRAAEIAVALLFAGLGALAMRESARIGAGWAADGPQSGYFPFYIGLIVAGASLITLVRAATAGTPRRAFAARAPLAQVFAVLGPSILYVAAIAAFGIYLASAAFIAYFMRRFGAYRWRVVLPIAGGVPVATFVVFELWFLVALPKGPVEAALGY